MNWRRRHFLVIPIDSPGLRFCIFLFFLPFSALSLYIDNSSSRGRLAQITYTHEIILYCTVGSLDRFEFDHSMNGGGVCILYNDCEVMHTHTHTRILTSSYGHGAIGGTHMIQRASRALVHAEAAAAAATSAVALATATTAVTNARVHNTRTRIALSRTHLQQQMQRRSKNTYRQQCRNSSSTCHMPSAT